MSANKSERLLNLLILLLVSRTYVSKDKIRANIEQYQSSTDEAFEKMFERDKDELRSLGIPIEVGSVDKFFDDEPGYRIKRDAFELPELEFSSDEVAVLGLATQVWRHAGQAKATAEALVKLKAGGVDVDAAALDALTPTLTAPEPSFDVMWEATASRTQVEFSYRRPGQTTSTLRHLQPWGVATAQDRWYVVGHDIDRDQTRMFRLSRIHSAVRTTGPPGSYDVPPGTDIRALTRSLATQREDRSARVLTRAGAAIGLRRRATCVATGVTGPDGCGDWDRLEVAYGSNADLAQELLGYAANVVVEEPPQLREAVLTRLRTLVAGQS